jgi:hypothetical protein
MSTAAVACAVCELQFLQFAARCLLPRNSLNHSHKNTFSLRQLIVLPTVQVVDDEEEEPVTKFTGNLFRGSAIPENTAATTKNIRLLFCTNNNDGRLSQQQQIQQQ